jgi:hypothetical protein
MPDLPEDWETMPNGCYDETHWKMCHEKGYIVHGAFCYHPGESYVRKDTGAYICRFHPDAVRYSEYYKKLEEDDD